VVGESSPNISMLFAFPDHDGQGDFETPCRLNRELKALQGSSFLLQYTLSRVSASTIMCKLLKLRAEVHHNAKMLPSPVPSASVIWLVLLDNVLLASFA
jgi:hypothetical protein